MIENLTHMKRYDNNPPELFSLIKISVHFEQYWDSNVTCVFLILSICCYFGFCISHSVDCMQICTPVNLLT